MVLGLIGLVVVFGILCCIYTCLVKLFPRCCPQAHQDLVENELASAGYPDPSDMEAVERANAARAPPIQMEEYHFGPPPHLQADAVTPKFLIQVSDFVLIFVISKINFSFSKFFELTDVPLI
jgi:hypothetical protein